MDHILPIAVIIDNAIELALLSHCPLRRYRCREKIMVAKVIVEQ